MGHIEGVLLTPLKKIPHPKGDILHAMKKSDHGYSGFGEAYFSTVHHQEIKGWKKHLKMTLNLVVPVGEIEFALKDDRPESASFGQRQTVILSRENFFRLTVPPGIWMAFRGLGTATNLLLNLANIEHDPAEGVARSLEEMSYEG